MVTVVFDSRDVNLARIEENTLAEFVSIEPTEIYLRDGSIFSLLENLKKDEPYQISTPTAVASVLGTFFRVTYHDSSNVVTASVYKDKNFEKVSAVDFSVKGQASKSIFSIKVSEGEKVTYDSRISKAKIGDDEQFDADGVLNHLTLQAWKMKEFLKTPWLHLRYSQEPESVKKMPVIPQILNNGKMGPDLPDSGWLHKNDANIAGNGPWAPYDNFDEWVDAMYEPPDLEFQLPGPVRVEEFHHLHLQSGISAEGSGGIHACEGNCEGEELTRISANNGGADGVSSGGSQGIVEGISSGFGGGETGGAGGGNGEGLIGNPGGMFTGGGSVSQGSVLSPEFNTSDLTSSGGGGFAIDTPGDGGGL
jgi:hypothetical protein